MIGTLIFIVPLSLILINFTIPAEVDSVMNLSWLHGHDVTSQVQDGGEERHGSERARIVLRRLVVGRPLKDPRNVWSPPAQNAKHLLHDVSPVGKVANYCPNAAHGTWLIAKKNELEGISRRTSETSQQQVKEDHRRGCS
jgi:hypothetical protein